MSNLSNQEIVNNSKSIKFEEDNDNRFLFNSAYMNIVRINAIADQMQRYVDEMLYKNPNDLWLDLHGVLSMAHLCKSLSSELLQHSDNIVITSPKEASHD
jgi:hypothetical protein